MNVIKESFQKVRRDIESIKDEMDFLKKDLKETKKIMLEMSGILLKVEKKTEELVKSNSTDSTSISTHSINSSTHNPSLKALKTQNSMISTGNQGVSTDRQTDTSTDRHTKNSFKKIETSSENTIKNALEILDSLDNIKKEIRLKFKKLTDQEILVFSAIYQQDEDFGYSDYKSLSEQLGLTESSIRDYVGRLVKKGIPVDKKKINNKNIHLSVSQNLKKIASLTTILELKDL